MSLTTRASKFSSICKTWREGKMAFLKALLIGKARQYGSVAATDELGKAWRSAIFKNAQTGEIYALATRPR